jgi:hypothetical protein
VLVAPSPKLQLHEVIWPEDPSLKFTGRGDAPAVGDPVNEATGGGTFVTVIRFGFVSVSEPWGPVTVRETV